MTALSKKRNELRNVNREFELAESKVAAWLIMNNNDSRHGTHGTGDRRNCDVAGKIIVRYTKRASIVSILFYTTGDTDDDAPAIFATETMTGCGYDRTALGISTVLWKLRVDLAKWHGIRFDCSETAMMNRWDQEFEKNGYRAIRVL